MSNYTEVELVSFGFEPPAARQVHNLDDDYVCPKEPASSTLRNIKFPKDSGKASSRTNQLGKWSTTPGPGAYGVPDEKIYKPRGAAKFSPMPSFKPKPSEKTGPITKIDVITAYNLTHKRCYGGVVSKKKRKMFGEVSKNAPPGTPMKDISVAWKASQPAVNCGAAWKKPAPEKTKTKPSGPVTNLNINYRSSEVVSTVYSMSKAARFKAPKQQVGVFQPGPGAYDIGEAEKKVSYMSKWASTKGLGRTSGTGYM